VYVTGRCDAIFTYHMLHRIIARYRVHYRVIAHYIVQSYVFVDIVVLLYVVSYYRTLYSVRYRTL